MRARKRERAVCAAIRRLRSGVLRTAARRWVRMLVRVLVRMLVRVRVQAWAPRGWVRVRTWVAPLKAQMQTRWRRGWWWRPGGGGGAGGRALLWGSCWRRAMSALALLRCACAASSLHHPATRRLPFPCCRFSRLLVANSDHGAAVPRVCEGGSAGLRRQAGTLPGYGDEGTCFPTLEAPNSLLPPPPLTEAPAPWSRLAWPGVSHKDPIMVAVAQDTRERLSLENSHAQLPN